MNICGIYRIVNTVTNRTYIGSSIRIATRMKDHRWALGRGIHVNRHLQSAWNKYGHDTFIFEQLITCKEEELENREQAFIDTYIEHDMALYNLKPSSESRSLFRYRATDETKAKQRAAFKGKKTGPLSLETKHKLSLALKGRVFSPAHLENMRLAKIANQYNHSAETKAKISAANKGNKRRLGAILSEDTKRKIGNANRNASLETRAKLSIAAKGRQTFLGRKHTADSKAKMSAARIRNIAKSKMDGLGLIFPTSAITLTA